MLFFLLVLAMSVKRYILCKNRLISIGEGMPHRFDVVPDNSGRINHFVAQDFSNDPISPESIGKHLDGGERITLSGVEYDLTQNGSLVHPDVEVIESAELGFGVRLGPGTTLRGFMGQEADRTAEDKIVIGDRTRIEGTEIQDQVVIGRHALILARSIGFASTIGDFSRMREGVVIQNRVTVGEAVKMAREVGVFSNVTIEDGVRLGHATRVGAGVTIKHGAKVGVRSGPDRTGANQGGSYISPGTIIPAKSVR
jgi:UDP-3-O-[3-hydroxymyristoyl] glucosamine N-acyltransferase